MDKSTYTDYKPLIILIFIVGLICVVGFVLYDYISKTGMFYGAGDKFEIWRREWWFRNKQTIYQILGIFFGGIVVIIIGLVILFRKGIL